MALKGIFVIAAACLLARMEVVSSLHSLFSVYKYEQQCGGDNLMKITNNCVTVAGGKQCEVNITGTTTKDPTGRTRFKIEKLQNKPGLYCIQFTDKHDSNKNYKLRAINGISLVFEEGACHVNIGSEFLFKQQATAGHMTYWPSIHTGKCLAGDCQKGLSVISVTSTTDRRCYFLKL